MKRTPRTRQEAFGPYCSLLEDDVPCKPCKLFWPIARVIAVGVLAYFTTDIIMLIDKACRLGACPWI